MTEEVQLAKVRKISDRIANATDTDVMLINSPMLRGLDDQLYSLLNSTPRRTNVLLILVTPGGDPDAAYRISKLLQTYYSKFTILVSGYCKSAGTLVVLGAHELVMSNVGELGPLDVQISKRDELGELSSGLVSAEALIVLQKKGFEMFETYFIAIKDRSEGQITFKTASEIAVKLTVGLLEPVYSQIDPIQVGETARYMKIGQDYGKRLAAGGKNLKPRTLFSLTETYPSHGFVIDRDEASRMFNAVRPPNIDEVELIEALGDCAVIARSQNQRITPNFLSTTSIQNGDEENENSAASSSAAKGAAPNGAASVRKGNGKNPRGTAKPKPANNSKPAKRNDPGKAGS